MPKISQNKKIALSAISLLIVSFSTMLFFLGSDGLNPEQVKTATLETGVHEESTPAEVPEGSAEKVETDTEFVTDLEGIIKNADPGFCKLFKKGCDKLVGKKFFDLVNKEDVGELASIFVKLGQDGKKMDSIGPIRLSVGSDKKLVILSAFPVKNEAGKVVKIKFSARDITEKAEGLGGDGGADDTAEEEGKKNWMEKIYPKIRDLNEQGNKLLVKISYKER